MEYNRRNFMKSGAMLAGAAALSQGLGTESLFAAPAAGPLPVNASGEYTLPPLPYAYNALEPHIDEQTMRLHHDIHHAGYVKGLNAALKAMEEARAAGNYSEIDRLAQKAAFHGSGHILHTIFWTNMAPASESGMPPPGLKAQIERDFGSVSAFLEQFKNTAAKVEGSGWGIAAWEPLGQRMVILQAEKHQNLTQWGVTPLLVVDVWEHAYYLKYQNKRSDYLDNFLMVVNWKNVAERLDWARRA